ncbi:MAG: hypothetical protein ABF443_13155 [Acetobacter malorum]|uniref:hypothetical protein n=1 Tax=Acetobacter malorum TaxID=178901 RepID=UPI0039ED9A37
MTTPFPDKKLHDDASDDDAFFELEDDDPPELTDDFFRKSELRRGDKIIRPMAQND